MNIASKFYLGLSLMKGNRTCAFSVWTFLCFLLSAENVDMLLTFAQEYLMPDLMGKCEHYLQEKTNKLGPCHPEHLNSLAVASTYNLSGLAKVLIPKVANLSEHDIRKYDGVIKSPLLTCVRAVMLSRYVPSMSMAPQHRSHIIIRSMQNVQNGCHKVGGNGGACVFCTNVYCTRCAFNNICGSRMRKKICYLCWAENCACFPELAEEQLNI